MSDIRNNVFNTTLRYTLSKIKKIRIIKMGTAEVNFLSYRAKDSGSSPCRGTVEYNFPFNSL